MSENPAYPGVVMNKGGSMIKYRKNGKGLGKSYDNPTHLLPCHILMGEAP